MPKGPDPGDGRRQVGGGERLVDEVQLQLGVEEAVEPRPDVAGPARQGHAQDGVLGDRSDHRSEPRYAPSRGPFAWLRVLPAWRPDRAPARARSAGRPVERRSPPRMRTRTV